MNTIPSQNDNEARKRERKVANSKFHLIFAPLGIVQTSLALRSLIAKIQNFKFFSSKM